MCGIAGIARSDGGPVTAETIESMCAAQSHRGPDARGIHVGEGVGLGIQRLRVIDLVTGDQPVYNEDGSIVVVLNGEIYNFRELRERLRAKGHTFATQGDTETIAHLYEELGPRCVEELHGMFAFALWDGRRRTLLLARDRVGKKPLFYSEQRGRLSFASELRALMSDPAVPDQVDDAALDAYLAYGCIPAPLTAYVGVRKLLPGHLLIHRAGRTEIERYWRLDYSRRSEARTRPEAEEQLREQIRAAVARRMVSDVPVGAFLSGGIDSAAVVAAMAEVSSGPVQTFSIGFEDEHFNELPQARLTAQTFGTDHHELVVRPDAVEMLPKVVRHYGEPFADHSALPSFYLARFAAEHVTVALNGDGGDESFAGYERYTTNLALAGLDRLPGPLRRGLSASARRVPLGGDPRRLHNRLGRFAIAAGGDPQSRYVAARQIFTRAQRESLYAAAYRPIVDLPAADEIVLGAWRTSTATALLDRYLDIDTRTYLPDDLLAKIDIATMAYSLEGRSPLLDHQLMEFAAALPAGWKAARGRRKLILRSALRGWVPDAILDGPKRGFRLPVAGWLRGDLRDHSREALLSSGSPLLDRFDRRALERLLDEHAAGTHDHGRGIWTLLVLAVWGSEETPRRTEDVSAGRPVGVQPAS